MATTYAQPPTTGGGSTQNGSSPTSPPNPQLKRIVYSKYRELLGSYNDKANAIIETLPAYMVREDRGFRVEPQTASGSTTPDSPAQASFKVLQQMVDKVAEEQQRCQQQYGDTAANDTREAPACVQNAMMTKDKKPFTYTPGGIDLSQIKSERMAKRLARNAQAEGATGSSQQNRPAQPHSPNSGSPGAAQTMGAAAMGMPFQVLPPPPPPPAPNAGNRGGAPPPPPPAPSGGNSTLAPPANGMKAPGSPNTQRKSPTPQRFEPPPLGFRPEIKIPPNPMAALRKVPPPVEKNTFWKDAYVKERSKSPLPESAVAAASAAAPAPSTNGQANNNDYNNSNGNGYDEYDEGYQKSPMPSAAPQRPEANNYTNNYAQQQPQQQQQPPQPKTPPMSTPTPPPSHTPQQYQQHQQQQSPRPSEFRSVQPPQSPAVNQYTRQTDSPRSDTATPPRATESPFRYGQHQSMAQQQPQHRAPPAVSPLAQQPAQTATPPPPASAGAGQPQAQTVPWRTQRATPQPQAQPSPMPTQSHPQPIYNNVQPQQQYQGPKPTNVGSLYIAPLAPPVEPQAQNIVRQQLQQQQQQQRDSPMRQMQPQQQQQQPQQQQQTRTPARWMTTQPAQKEQPEWVRPEENGNVVPSSLNRMKSPPPPQQQQQQQYGNGYATAAPSQMGQNFGSHTGTGTTGLRLQINTNSVANQSGPKERIIPIQLEQTPTYTPAQPSFSPNPAYNNNNNNAPTGYVIRSPNQFVDQGYNNYPSSGGPQRVMSPTPQLNAPRMIQTQQQQQQQQMSNNTVGGNKTRIIPIAMEGGDGTRGPISQAPIVIQNGNYNLVVHECPIEAEIRYRKSRLSDPRSPPIQSKSFRILQKITDTAGDDDSADGNGNTNANSSSMAEPQLQRPQFGRQMSAQQVRNSPTIEQMRRMQIAQDQQQSPAWNQGNTPNINNKFVQQQRPIYNNDMQQQQPYIPPSEQQVLEPKKYTGSAIPSRSFKILQAMTTPENAAEVEDSDSNELNEITQKILNKYKQNHEEQDNENHSNASASASSTPTPTPPPTNPTSVSSSASSLISNDSLTNAMPPHYAPAPPPPYGYPPYPYWPMPNGADQPPPANWPYPYPIPMPPPPLNSQGNCENSAPYPYPYPYCYPFYPPPPFNPHQSSPGPQSSNDSNDFRQTPYYDPQLYGAYMPPPYPYTQYPYPVAPSYSQSSNSSRASSVLPDIIVTPSSDESPSQVIMQHHVKVDRKKPQRSSLVDIEEVDSETRRSPSPMRRDQREGSVIDVLTKRLEDMSPLNMNLSNDVKEYVGEQDKEFGEKSPIENASPVQQKESECDDDDSSDDSSDSEETPKCEEDDKNGSPAGLQAIKSVTNIQVYKGRQNLNLLEDSDDDEDDVTTADGESDIFDEDEDEHGHLDELELDRCIEENDDQDFMEEEDLSTIYEESEMERTSEYPRTVIKRPGSSISDATTLENDDDVEKKIEENDDDDGEDSTSVTVRLPLKFSFSRSSNDENIATVEVGKTEERRHSLSLEEKRNSFSIAKLKDASDDEHDEEYDDDCEVSVTISLTPSSRSSSIDRKTDNRQAPSTAYPIEDIAKPKSVATSSSEDVSVSFSLNMSNKAKSKSDISNNQEIPKKENKIESPIEPPEEMDFFATLRATKLQAQKIKEQSASYWGKSLEKKAEDVKEKPSAEIQTVKKSGEIDDIWADRKEDTPTIKKLEVKSSKASLESAKNDFWASVSEATKDPLELSSEVDFWTSIESSKNSAAKNKTKPDIQKMRETLKVVPYSIKNLRMKFESMAQPQNGVRSFIEPEPEPEPEPVQESVEESEEDEDTEEEVIEVEEDNEEEDFWASVEKAKASKVSSEQEPTIENIYVPLTQAEEDTVPDNFWDDTSLPDTENTFDPSKYPEEPREVDTDEEIDFWAEIEAKNKHNDDGDVNFYKSATFWADRERNKSIDETPYSPVLTKPFAAKLPDQTEAIDVVAVLEAAKGDEPIIVDPVVEEENQLAEEFNNMEHEDEDNESEEEPQEPQLPPAVEAMGSTHWTDNDDALTETASVHEPIVANVWVPSNGYATSKEIQNGEPEVDFWAEIEGQREQEKPTEMDELEVKRNNYRKAMAFFTTSVDDHKEQSVDRFTKSSAPIEASAVEEASNTYTNDEPVVQQQSYDIDLGPPGEYEIVGEEPETTQAYYNAEESEPSSMSSSESNSTPTNFESKLPEPQAQQLPEVFIEPTLQPPRKLLSNGLPDLGVNKFNEENKISVKDRIFAFETGSVDVPDSKKAELKAQSLSVESCSQPSSTLSRNNSSQRSESEIEEEDSGVTDMNKPLSETDTESDSFPELRKMSSYQRAATHSRLFKLLQDDNDEPGSGSGEPEPADEFQFKPSRRKIVHNVSITRKQNPKAVAQAESMTERRERLSLPLRKNTSIDADNPSTPASPASPAMGQPMNNKTVVSDKLVNELVQSLLLKSDSTHLRHMPMEKLQAAAKRALAEELDSLDSTSVDSTPAITPADPKKDKSYAEYYDSWSDASGASEIIPSKAFRALQDGPKRSPWSVRCPRVLSSKTINRDLARVTESPEIFSRTSKSPDCVTQGSREGSVSRWRKV